VLHAYVESDLGKRRWFLHKRGNAPLVTSQHEMSYLQQQFLVLAHNEYGPDRSQLPRQAQQQL
jgi:hypothetical protein